MFFIHGFGPWMPSLDVLIHSETSAELLRQTVQSYSIDVSSRRRFRRKSSHESITLDDPVGIQFEADKKIQGQAPLHKCTYKPKTLKAFVNKPGRVLVKRLGIRGSSGRFIVAGILVLGIIAVALNFGDRDNWLEIAFDGAQVMSLVAGVAVAVVSLINETLTSTLDWLGGVTEVMNEGQLAKALGVSVEEIKVACSYEKGFLFWLFEENSSFCPASKHGAMIFEGPLNMNLASPHLRFGSVIEKDCGLWILQGWAFRIEKKEEIGHMVKVPYEDRVYVEDDIERKRPFI